MKKQEYINMIKFIVNITINFGVVLSLIIGFIAFCLGIIVCQRFVSDKYLWLLLFMTWECVSFLLMTIPFLVEEGLKKFTFYVPVINMLEHLFSNYEK